MNCWVQVLWAHKTEHPTQTLVFTKTARHPTWFGSLLSKVFLGGMLYTPKTLHWVDCDQSLNWVAQKWGSVENKISSPSLLMRAHLWAMHETNSFWAHSSILDSLDLIDCAHSPNLTTAFNFVFQKSNKRCLTCKVFWSVKMLSIRLQISSRLSFNSYCVIA